MRYLLDTHVLIWLFENNEKLSTKMREDILFNAEHQIFVSMVSFWEAAIKMNIGKLNLEGGFSQFCKLVIDNEFEILEISMGHIERLFALSLLHRDPFDRLLIATALAEDLVIITADENIHKYDVSWVW